MPRLTDILYRVVYVDDPRIENALLTDLQTTVSTNPFAASMSSANFANPWKFDPNRWIDENREDTLEASQPLSLGPRACLGRT